MHAVNSCKKCLAALVLLRTPVDRFGDEERENFKLCAGSQEADSSYICASLSCVINTSTSGLHPWVDNPKALMKPDIAPTLHQLDKLGFHAVIRGSWPVLQCVLSQIPVETPIHPHAASKLICRRTHCRLGRTESLFRC